MDEGPHEADVLGILARERSGALLGYALLVAGERAAAEDLVQDALVKVFSRLRQGFTPDDAERYVRRAILTIHLDGYRRTTRWRAVRHLLARNDVADDGAPGVADATDVHAALRTLTPRHRACIVLRYFDDLTVPAIAAELGLAEGTVKRYLSDALASLATVLGPFEESPAAAVETWDVTLTRARKERTR
ncbi:MAG: sigma-70 family RNA polymerase sigma factor [Actinomycetales bacterium]|nr:sigma-70 family RNA polymerase sigma factor [Actinomycetales bacterium]